MDWTQIIIAAIPPTLAAILSWWRLSNRITTLHVEINSRMTELLKVTRESGFAAGVTHERDKVPDA